MRQANKYKTSHNSHCITVNPDSKKIIYSFERCKDDTNCLEMQFYFLGHKRIILLDTPLFCFSCLAFKVRFHSRHSMYLPMNLQQQLEMPDVEFLFRNVCKSRIAIFTHSSHRNGSHHLNFACHVTRRLKECIKKPFLNM